VTRAGAWRAAEKRVRQHPGRQALPAELAAGRAGDRLHGRQCVCGGCGRETTVIGPTKRRAVGCRAAKYFVVVTKREKRAARVCEERGVQGGAAATAYHREEFSERPVVD